MSIPPKSRPQRSAPKPSPAYEHRVPPNSHATPSPMELPHPIDNSSVNIVPDPDPGPTYNDGALEFDNSGMFVFDLENWDRVSSGSSVLDADSIYDDSGRSYNGWKQGKYFLPNDAAEQDRLDMQYAMLKILLDGDLYWAPVENPEYVLDVATGTGIWAIEFAEKHPQSQVIGTDLSDIQPDVKERAPNCTFVRDDAEEEWLYGSTDNPIQFDYVHFRYCFTCFDDYRSVVRQAYKNLKPGGYIEFLEASPDMQSMDGNLQGTAFHRWCSLFQQGMRLHGRDPHLQKQLKSWLIEEGFTNVNERRLLCPGNPWAENPKMKKIGYFMLANAYAGLRGASWKLLKEMGLTSEDIEELVEESKRNVASRSLRWYQVVYVVWGQKPYEGHVQQQTPGP